MKPLQIAELGVSVRCSVEGKGSPCDRRGRGDRKILCGRTGGSRSGYCIDGYSPEGTDSGCRDAERSKNGME